MRFGGHETFALREGWLYKGLTLLKEQPAAFSDPEVADYLGVGRNMAKSIRHWLEVTGLVNFSNKTPSRQPEITHFGNLVLKHDPYMLEIGTWWALHFNLVTQKKDAVTWYWFFNQLVLERFDRNHCAERLNRYLESRNEKQPTPKTLMNDVLCLLNSYAQPIPAEQVDPEDSLECPFRELGLITYFLDSGMYQLQREVKDIPAHLLGYVMSSTFGQDAGNSETFTVSLRESLSAPGSPGRVFALNPDALWDLMQSSEHRLDKDLLMVRMHGGERVVQLRNKAPLDWLAQYYWEA